jgi:hypothetical protein
MIGNKYSLRPPVWHYIKSGNETVGSPDSLFSPPGEKNYHGTVVTRVVLADWGWD